MSKKIILSNIFSLSFIQIANYLLPFITIPYVVRIIGPDKLGIINLAQAIVAYLIIIVNFGFDFTATREISVNRNNKTVLNEIFSSVIFSKLVLFIITVVILIIIINLNEYREYSLVIFFTFIAVLANVLFPTWYFQGTEQLTKTAIVNFLSRLLTLVLTFMLIQNPDDYILYPLIISSGQLIFNTLSFIYVIKTSKLLLVFPKPAVIKKTLFDGFTIFFSSIVINIYLMGSIIILGLYASSSSVGYFSAASKIIVLFQSIILYPVYQTLFPHLSKSLSENVEKGLMVLKKMFFLVLGITSIGSIFVFFFSRLIILIIYGDKFLGAVICLKVVSILLIITGVSNVLGVQGLVNLKKDKVFLAVTGTAAMLSIFLNIYFASNLQELGTSIAWVITESIVMIGFIFSYIKIVPAMLGSVNRY